MDTTKQEQIVLTSYTILECITHITQRVSGELAIGCMRSAVNDSSGPSVS